MKPMTCEIEGNNNHFVCRDSKGQPIHEMGVSLDAQKPRNSKKHNPTPKASEYSAAGSTHKAHAPKPYSGVLGNPDTLKAKIKGKMQSVGSLTPSFNPADLEKLKDDQPRMRAMLSAVNSHLSDDFNKNVDAKLKPQLELAKKSGDPKLVREANALIKLAREKKDL